MLIFTLILGVSLLGIYFLVSPHIFYSSIVKKGKDYSWYRWEKTQKKWLSPVSPLEWTLKNQFSALDWKSFHLENFEIPLPLKNLPGVALPFIEEGARHPHVGLNFVDENNQAIITLKMLEVVPFKFQVPTQKILQIPFLKRLIYQKNSSEIFSDLYDLSLQETPEDYVDLLYGLYILSLRADYFSPPSYGFYFSKERQVGINILELKEDKKVLKVTFFKKGMLYSYHLTLWNHPLSQAMGKKWLNEIEYKEEGEGDADRLFAEFKTLSRDDQESFLGFYYLFSAWSHNLQKDTLLKEMIRTLEKGKGNLYFLEPLYAYAYNRYGSSLSSEESKIKEQAEMRLKRLIKEEEERERQQMLRHQEKEAEIDLGKLSDEARMQYLLKKAKGANQK